MILSSKKIKALFVGVLLVAKPLCCQEFLATSIIVEESKVIRAVPKSLLGVNHNWIQSERLVWNKRINTISPEFVRLLSGFSLPFNRMSGATSQVFHWKEAIGVVGTRKEQQLAPYDQKGKKYFGPLEWIESTRFIDPEAMFSWVVNMKTESFLDHADLAEFFLSDGLENPNDGINWGAKRREYGVPYPIPIEIWELGNEMDWAGGAFVWPIEKYLNECVKIIKAIRSVDPDAKIAVHAATAPMGQQYMFKDWRAWHRTLLHELGDKIDYVSFHAYYSLNLPSSIFEKYLDIIKEDIVTITGSKRIKLYISEHAVWPVKPKSGPRKWEDTWCETHSLGGCLLTAQFLNRLLQRSEVDVAAYHSLSGGPWGIFYPRRNGELYTTGIFDLFLIFNDSFGQDVVFSSVHGLHTDATEKSLTFTLTAMTTKKGLSLILVNREVKKAREIVFQFEGRYELVGHTLMTAASMESYNTENEKQIVIKTKELTSQGEFYKLVMPSKSIVVLTLEKIPKNGMLHASETKF